MKQDQFERIFTTVVNEIEDVLVVKAREYVMGDDRLHNFKRAAALLKTTSQQALIGMLTKHIVSIYDYADRHEKGEYFSPAQWKEKIYDYLNYGILLYALIIDEEQGRTTGGICPTSDPTNSLT